MPVAMGFEKAKIYRGFLPIKEVIKTDNSDRTSTPNTFVATSHRENEYTVMLSLSHGDRVSLHYFFLSFLSLQMNEILKVELQFISSQCALDVSIIVGKPKAHSVMSVYYNVTLQILKFISVS